MIWNICIGLRTNHSAVRKSRMSEIQCLRKNDLRQSSNRNPCLPTLAGFETHRQWPLWLQHRDLATTLKPYMRYFKITLGRTVCKIEEEALLT